LEVRFKVLQNSRARRENDLRKWSGARRTSRSNACTT
jgi:hypothetical protein